MLANNEQKIYIICPVCQKSGWLMVPKEPIQSSQKGLTTITIEKTICDHTFIVYLDKNFNIRAREQIDFVPAPGIAFEIKDVGVAPFTENDMDLLQLNLYPLTFNYILKSFLNKKSIGIILIKEKEFLADLYDALFDYIFAGTFEITYKILSEDEYRQVKEELNLDVIVRDVEIIKDKDKIITDADLGVVRGFTQRFFKENFGVQSVNYLKNEIKNAYLLSSSVAELVNKKKNLNLNKIIKNLEKEFDVEINVRYGEFLLDIVKNYYGIEVKDIYKNIEFLKFKKLSK